MMHPSRLTAAFLAASILASCSSKEDEPEQKEVAISIETAAARRGSVQTWTFGEGTARATRREYLNFENPGRITYLNPELREGDRVTKGTELAHQDQRSPQAELDTAASSVVEAETQSDVTQAELEQARTELALAQTTFERFKVLLARESASKQEFDEAKAKADNAASAVTSAQAKAAAARAQIRAAEARMKQAEVTLEQTELRAPIDGIVARLNVVEGFYTTPSLVRTDSEESLLQTIPALIIDPESLEITVDVAPALGNKVTTGQDVLIRPGAEAGGNVSDFDPQAFPVKGKVYSVTPSISPDRRTIQVKIRTTDGGEKLQDGTFCTVWIATSHHEDVLVAPLDAFVYRENEPYVFIADDGKARLSKVEMGFSGIDSQEITEGLSEGDLIVTRGRYQLSDGVAVRVLNSDELQK